VQYESIAHLVERTVHSVRQNPECRTVQVMIAELESVDAWVDSVKLGRALYNLVLNACQATKTGTVPPTVTITLSEDAEKIRIAICDTGKGVPAAIRGTLFQPFVSSGKVNGTGLGLTVAQHVAQEHGGEVRLEKSEPGRTIFSILLFKKALQALGQNQSESYLGERTAEQEGAEAKTGHELERERL